MAPAGFEWIENSRRGKSLGELEIIRIPASEALLLYPVSKVGAPERAIRSQHVAVNEHFSVH